MTRAVLSRTPVRVLATAFAGALVLGAAAPALAVGEVARGTATAVNLSVAGNPGYSGTYVSTHDGSKETTTGSNKPAVSVLGGQRLISAGTLNQDARTTVQGGTGRASACAGLAGQGATLVSVGQSSCLRPGESLTLDAGSLDLSGLTLVRDSTLLDNIPEPLKSTLSNPDTLAQLTSALSDGLAQAQEALGNPGLHLDLGVLQSTCTAVPRDAQGSADLADAKLVVDIPGQDPVTIADLPVHPAPNTDAGKNLGGVSAAVLAAIKTDLEGSFGGALGALVPVADQATVINNALDQLSTQLDPVTSQVVSLILNKQSRPDDDSIDVTALALRVLPAAKAQAGFDALDLDIGHVTCTAGRFTVDAPVVAAPSTVPTVVDAGQSGTTSSGLVTVLGGLFLLAGAGIGVRRLLGSRG